MASAVLDSRYVSSSFAKCRSTSATHKSRVKQRTNGSVKKVEAAAYLITNGITMATRPVKRTASIKRLYLVL